VRNRGIARGRLFLGALLLLAAIITWAVGEMMSPHGDVVAKGTEHVKTVVVTYMRNSAIGTLVLSALAAWLLFPARRPKWPARDWALIVVLVLLAGSSLYTLAWLQFGVLR
jgi:drug/metabolite transporter (DMT)-like permease